MHIIPEVGKLITDTAGDETSPLANRITTTGLIGSMNRKEDLPLLRKIVQDKSIEASILRTSIGSIGLIGLQSDIELIQPFLNHRNRGVIKAAQAALNRLNEKFPTEEDSEN